MSSKAAMRMTLMSILQNLAKKCIPHIVINNPFDFIISDKHFPSILLKYITIDMLPDNNR